MTYVYKISFSEMKRLTLADTISIINSLRCAFMQDTNMIAYPDPFSKLHPFHPGD
jgi:hypothetical protein